MYLTSVPTSPPSLSLALTHVFLLRCIELDKVLYNTIIYFSVPSLNKT